MSTPEQQQDQPPLIKIVKKSGHEGHHGGAWKVAYADFVTAMMALFIVLWILNQSEDMKRGVGGYFRDPAGKALLGAGPGKENSTLTFAGRKRAMTASMVDFEQSYNQMKAEAEKLKDMIEVEPELQALKEQITVEVTDEGVRMEVQESEREPLFETGSAELSPRFVKALRVLARQIRKYPLPIILEGHTDSMPYSPESTMTNWDLSTMRANEARRILEISGIPDAQVFAVRGYAERKPRFDDPADPRNRRISILMLNEESYELLMRDRRPPAETEPEEAMETAPEENIETIAQENTEASSGEDIAHRGTHKSTAIQLIASTQPVIER